MAERVGSGSRLWRRHFARRQDPFTSAILVFPVFFAHQLGVLAGLPGRNGVDYITINLIELCRRDLVTYLQLLGAMITAYLVCLLWLRHRGHFHPWAFLPTLAESSVYAFFMGGVIQLVLIRFGALMPQLAIGSAGAGEIMMVSAGAGFHEELVFRAGLMAGMIRLFALPGVPLGRSAGLIVALLFSSLIFSLVHHAGPGGEPFTSLAFSYRALAGVIFGLVYQLRGFAVAVWTHTLYDVLVFTLG